MKFTLMVLTGIMALSLLGCETPKRRIARNPEQFLSWPQEVQEAVRKGEVRVGFDKDMVTVALGKPERIYARTTASGMREIWSYVSYKTTPTRQRVSGRFRVRDASGRYQTVRDNVWVTIDERLEYEHLRIEFADERVEAIEEIQY